MDQEYPADKATVLSSSGSAPKRLLLIAVSCLFLSLSAFLHFWNLANVPPGFYRDESSITYNAYSIAETGADEYGSPFPLFFRAFDNYHDPVMVYSTVPLVKIFGLVKWAGRSVSGFYFLLASLAFGLLVFEHTQNHWLSIVFAFVFSVTPWGFVLSRGISAGYTPMLLGLILGHLYFLRAFRLNSLPSAIAAGFSYGFAMYAHNIGRPMAALYICCLFIAFLPSILKKSGSSSPLS